MTNGYNFYFANKQDKAVLTFPITPSELTISVGSKNETVSLINGGDINVLKSPSLVEISFDARFPMRKYPYSREVDSFQSYFDRFRLYKENKQAFKFIVVRTTPDGTRTWDTEYLVALEDFSLKESADEGDDVIVSIKLKQYKEYGVVALKVKNSNSTTTSSSEESRGGSPCGLPTTHTIVAGDTLCGISRKYYETETKWRKIYNANKEVIRETAIRRWSAAGHKGRDDEDGQWIFPGTKLTIPK